jgi:AraC-like DNA-binding protein
LRRKRPTLSHVKDAAIGSGRIDGPIVSKFRRDLAPDLPNGRCRSAGECQSRPDADTPTARRALPHRQTARQTARLFDGRGSHVSREIVSIEVNNPAGPVPQWETALSEHVGHVLPDARDQEITRCVPVAGQAFQARLEYGALADAILFKVLTTPHYFRRSLTSPTAKLPAPIVLIFQSSGSGRFRQGDRSFVLHPGDWCLLDTLHPIETWVMTKSAEVLSVSFPRPSDPEQQRLLSKAAAYRFDAKVGVSRILQKTLVEVFGQLNCLARTSGLGLRAALMAMLWDALREQLAAPAALSCRDVLNARAKAYIEAHLSDPDLSVEGIAEACEASVRSLQRAFARDSAVSVSRYIWDRRVSRCADALRDGKEACQRITEICLSWGFNSTSHFSRLFKEKFGVPPRIYRANEGGSS